MVVPKSDIYSEFSFETGEKVELIDGGYYYVVNSGKMLNFIKKLKLNFKILKDLKMVMLKIDQQNSYF
jgi:hypothetical protein